MPPDGTACTESTERSSVRNSSRSVFFRNFPGSGNCEPHDCRNRARLTSRPSHSSCLLQQRCWACVKMQQCHSVTGLARSAFRQKSKQGMYSVRDT